jgi:hypothetical protein
MIMFRRLLVFSIKAFALLALLAVPHQLHAQGMRAGSANRMMFPFSGRFTPGFRGGFEPRFDRGMFEPRFNRGMFEPRFDRRMFEPRFNRGMFDPRFNGGMFDPRFNTIFRSEFFRPF